MKTDISCFIKFSKTVSQNLCQIRPNFSKYKSQIVIRVANRSDGPTGAYSLAYCVTCLLKRLGLGF